MRETYVYEAAEQVRRRLEDDTFRFERVSGATALRRADPKRDWTEAGFFSFERGGRLYTVTVEAAAMDPKPEPRQITIYRWAHTSWAWKPAIPTYYHVRFEDAEQNMGFETMAEAMAYCQGERNAYQRLGYDVIVVDAAPPGED